MEDMTKFDMTNEDGAYFFQQLAEKQARIEELEKELEIQDRANEILTRRLEEMTNE